MADLIEGALTDLVTAKAKIPGLSGTSDEDDVINRLINATTMAFESFLGRKLVERVYKPTGALTGQSPPEVNLKLDGDRRLSPTTLLWPHPPITSVTSLVIKDRVLTHVKTLDIASDLVFEPESGLMELIDGDAWERGLQNIEPTITAGYASDRAERNLLEEACIDQVTWFFHHRDRLRQGMKSISADGQTVQFLTKWILPEIKSEIGTMRLRRVA